MTPEEQKIIDELQAEKKRPLTQQEINLSLDQARQIGELPQINNKGSGYKVTTSDS